MKDKSVIRKINSTWERNAQARSVRRKACLFALMALGATSCLSPVRLQAASTWTGAGADANWSTPNNWNGNQEPAFPTDLIFAGTAQLANNNDLSGITASNLTFDVAAGAFDIGGNPLSLNGSIGFN